MKVPVAVGLKMLLFLVALCALIGVLSIMFASYSGWTGNSAGHDSFFFSRKFYHDDITDLCFMVLSDKFGRGITIVPCEKVPSSLLIHLRKHGSATSKKP